MGIRMSVGLSWARTEPSRISTRAWTMLWGWMRTPSWSGPRSNSQRASMSSRPLFIKRRRIHGHFLPIFQRGWARASSTVFVRSSRQGRPEKRPARGGQDHLSHVAPVLPGQALEDAAVLGIHGDDLGPGRAGLPCCRRAPATTMDSLLARATVLPARTAARVGRSPLIPVMAETTISLPGPGRPRSAPSGPEDDRGPRSSEPRPESGPRPPSCPSETSPGRNSADLFFEKRQVRARGQRRDAERLGMSGR